MRRREYLQATGSAAVTPAFVGLGRVPGDASALVADGQGILWWSIPDDRVIERHGSPSFIVETDDDRSSSIQEWADRDTDRHIVETDAIADWHGALVACPYSAAETLAGYSWVTFLDLDFEVGLPEPVAPRTADAVDPLADLSWRQTWGVSESDVDAGLAYDEDMSPTDMQDVRGHTAEASGDLTNLTSSVTVAAIDTGLNEDDDGTLFGSRVLDASWNVIDDVTYGSDDTAVEDGKGHGTFVGAEMASAASEPYQGYAPGASVLAIKVLDDEGSGSTWDVARGIRHAGDQAADVACLSLGAPLYSASTDRAIAYATGAGTVCVAATGNDRYGTRWVANPANSPDALAVAATTGEPPADAKVGYYANHGPHPGTTDGSGAVTADAAPDLVAPGCKITTKVATTAGGTETETLTGTSMAAPCVAGGVAQLVADTGLDDPDEIRDRIRIAEPMPGAGETEDGANGMLSVQRAVDEDRADNPDETDSNASKRDDIHRRWSDLSGRQVARLF